MAFADKRLTMAIASDIHHPRSTLADLKADVIARWTRYRLYRETLSELSALSAHDLADIGLNRSQIRGKAYEIAYGPTA